jgi:GMP synthase (glutamine-hydrolysing)
VAPEILRPFRGEVLGEADGTVAASVVYGGPFNVFEEDRHPFLREEARWISQCMERGIPLLGICQGAQQIARVLGAEVGPKPGEPTEFGYYEITPTEQGRGIFPERLVVSQSHFHTFQIPPGATHLAGSALFPNQAFRHGEMVYGFQFHAEVTPQGFRRWQDAPWARYGKPGAQTRHEQDHLMSAHDKAQHDWFMGFLDRLFGPAMS